MSRRMPSRAMLVSAPANMSEINSRSSSSRSRNLLPRLFSLCASRSSAERIAPSNSGLTRSRHSPSRSLQSQTSVSLVSECSRMPRSSCAAQFRLLPGLDKDARDVARPRGRDSTASAARRARVQCSPSAAGIAARTRFSLPAGSLGKIVTRRGSSSRDDAGQRQLGIRCSLGRGQRSSKSSRAMTSSSVNAGLNFWFRTAASSIAFTIGCSCVAGSLEFAVELDDLIERRGLLLRLTRLIEERDQLVGARNLFAAQFDRLGLLGRDVEIAVLFQRLRRASSTTSSIPLR